MGITRILVFCSLFLVKADGRPVQQKTRSTKLSVGRALSYLTTYGYLKERKTPNPRGATFYNNNHKLPFGAQNNYLTETDVFDEVFTNELKAKKKSRSGFTRDEIKNALFKLQSFGQLRLTGQLDSDTQQIVESPRCGVQDIQNKAKLPPHITKHWRVKVHRRVRRFVQQGSKWGKKLIKWTIPSNKFSSKMKSSLVKSTITKAFRFWAEVIPLVFRWESDPSLADITMVFVKGYHGDTKAFDGPGNQLAHAYYPKDGGDIHFDDDEAWTPSTSDKTHTSLLKVAVHEIGHSLGLDHSTVSGSVMNPVYTTLGSSLGDDDIKGVQAIYGMCDPLSIKSIDSSMFNGKTYIFKGDNYWRFDDQKDKISTGYPQPSSTWKGIPNDIDEMLLWGHNYRIYFFKGDLYYRYNEQDGKVDVGYPRNISKMWRGVPSNIDAAFSQDYYTTYFFKGNLCYKYDNRRDQVAYGYPKQISSEWPGIHYNIDSVFRYMYNGATYFFKGGYYWRWNSYTHTAVGPSRIMNGWKNICDV